MSKPILGKIGPSPIWKPLNKGFHLRSLEWTYPHWACWLQLLLCCLSDFPIAITKQQDQGNLQRIMFHLGLMVSLPSWQGALQQTGRHGTRAVTESLCPYPQVGGREKVTENGVDFWSLKHAPTKWHTFSNKATSPNPSQTVPSTGNQVC